MPLALPGNAIGMAWHGTARHGTAALRTGEPLSAGHAHRRPSDVCVTDASSGGDGWIGTCGAVTISAGSDECDVPITLRAYTRN